MKILIRNAVIIDPGSDLHETRNDLLLEDGILLKIGVDLSAGQARVWEGEDLHVSPGWVDIGAHTMDPGFEHREDLHSFCRAAAAGGYTHVAVFPNTEPFAHSKAEILYLRGLNHAQAVRLLPIGGISRNGAGEDIAEMYDMKEAGAVAFSDGAIPVQRSGLLLRALLYVKAMNGLVIDQPLDLSLAAKGQVHEGVVSTALGLRGIPALAESSQVYRNIQLLRYAGSRLVLHALSAAESLPVIQAARAEGLDLRATVPALNLVYTDEALSAYDTHFKVMPPLRAAEDREALRLALQEGLIDAIVSNHLPLEEDQKDVEFPYAAFGASALETTFALCHTHLVPELLSLSDLVDRICHRPRRMLGLDPAAIMEGAGADLTVFQPGLSWTFRTEAQFSLGRNNPLQGQSLQGRVLGVIRGRHAFQRSDRGPGM
jgi:dihydroorotase